MDLGNSHRGVWINNGAQWNTIGTNGDGLYDEMERNVISGNDQYGVQIQDAGTENNVVAGNYIGTDAAGTLPIGNSWEGVWLYNGARFNCIGTDGNETFTGNTGLARLTGADFHNLARYFDAVYADPGDEDEGNDSKSLGAIDYTFTEHGTNKW